MEKKEMKIQKIPLDNLIDTLVSIYNAGVDYIDLYGIQGEDCDEISVAFTKDYMTEEGKKNFEEDEKTSLSVKSHKLTDDDINQLI
jgi:hypothetical protein